MRGRKTCEVDIRAVHAAELVVDVGEQLQCLCLLDEPLVGVGDGEGAFGLCFGCAKVALQVADASEAAVDGRYLFVGAECREYVVRPHKIGVCVVEVVVFEMHLAKAEVNFCHFVFFARYTELCDGVVEVGLLVVVLILLVVYLRHIAETQRLKPWIVDEVGDAVCFLKECHRLVVLVKSEFHATHPHKRFGVSFVVCVFDEN